jgi:hypothetical protein
VYVKRCAIAPGGVTLVTLSWLSHVAEVVRPSLEVAVNARPTESNVALCMRINASVLFAAFPAAS